MRQRKHLISASLALAMVTGLSSHSLMPSPVTLQEESKELTTHDLDKLLAAKIKRERKALLKRLSI